MTKGLDVDWTKLTYFRDLEKKGIINNWVAENTESEDLDISDLGDPNSAWVITMPIKSVHDISMFHYIPEPPAIMFTPKLKPDMFYYNIFQLDLRHKQHPYNVHSSSLVQRAMIKAVLQKSEVEI